MGRESPAGSDQLPSVKRFNRRLTTIPDAEFFVDRNKSVFHGTRCDSATCCDFVVGCALGQITEDFGFTRSESERVGCVFSPMMILSIGRILRLNRGCRVGIGENR